MAHKLTKTVEVFSRRCKIWLFGGALLLLVALVYGAFYRPIKKERKEELTKHKTNHLTESALDHQMEAAALSASTSVPFLEARIREQVSNNFQKLFLFFKLEHAVQEGQDVSSLFARLERVMGGSLDDGRFHILRDPKGDGISLESLETSLRSYILDKPHSADSSVVGRVLSFLKGVLIIRRQDRSGDMDHLCFLIRHDRIKEAIIYIEKNAPAYLGWSYHLRHRLAVKQALKALEDLVFDTLRLT